MIRVAIGFGAVLGLLVLGPAAASADLCSRNAGTALRDSGGYEWDFSQGTAAPDRNEPFAAFADGGSNGPGGTPPGPRATGDSYDSWGTLFVGGIDDAH